MQYVANEVSKDTRAVKIRATIHNPGARLKSDMLVKAMLDIPPIPGQTVIPRHGDGLDQRRRLRLRPEAHRPPGGPTTRTRTATNSSGARSSGPGEQRPGGRRGTGSSAGEEVATNGSLILAQLYEDRERSRPGCQASEPGGGASRAAPGRATPGLPIKTRPGKESVPRA